ncbi:MAG TPA: RsmG family class I SAM-dependent methyltransferase [Planctomycetota bacterium]
MSPFPGIPEAALDALDEPNPFDVGALRQAVGALADPPDGPMGALLEYGRLLLAANTVVNLTGAKDWQELIEAHLLDCVLAAAFVPDDARVIADWGSGAGLPGLVWAILFPEKRFLLLERTGKKADFLQEAAFRLQLFQVDVLQGQGEEALKAAGERPDLIVARAVEPLDRLLPRLRRNRVHHSSLFVMAGPQWEAQWAALDADGKEPWALAARHRYPLGSRGDRWLLVLHPRGAAPAGGRPGDEG